MKVQTEGHLQCTADRNLKTGQWVGECEPLGLVVEAGNLEELTEAFTEAVLLLLEDLREDGELLSYFTERGLEPPTQRGLSDGPQDSAANIPWELIAHNEIHGTKLHAA